MHPNAFAPGWTSKPEAVKEFKESGRSIAFGSDIETAQFRGNFRRLVAKGVTGVFLEDAETELFGSPRPAFSQNDGTCTGQALARSLQDRLYNQAVMRGELLQPVEFCFEPIYIGSRTKREIGNNRLGRSQGSIGAWTIQYIYDYGVLPRGVYGQYDLRKPQEKWAVGLSNPGGSVPPELEAASRPFFLDGCYHAEDLELLADGISAGYPAQRCANLIYGDPDANGMCKIVGEGGHSQEVVGVFLDLNGDICLVEQQSWGNYPAKIVTLRYAGGSRKLRQGCYGVDGRTWWQRIQDGGEVWNIGEIHGPQLTTNEALK